MAVEVVVANWGGAILSSGDHREEPSPAQAGGYGMEATDETRESTGGSWKACVQPSQTEDDGGEQLAARPSSGAQPLSRADCVAQCVRAVAHGWTRGRRELCIAFREGDIVRGPDSRITGLFLDPLDVEHPARFVVFPTLAWQGGNTDLSLAR